VKIFEEAKAGYLKKGIELLEQKLDEIKKSGQLNDLNFSLTKPASYEKEYTKAISMLEWSVDDELVLDHQQFSNFVLDEWNWSRGFYTSNVRFSELAMSGCAMKGYNA
jgi:hypothetical protein